MFTRYIVGTVAILGLFLVTSITAAPSFDPQIHPGTPCVRDPRKRIGEGYTIMWQGAKGKSYWTSGKNGNNANYINGDMRFQSGSSTLDENRFMLKVKNPGVPDYVAGFVVKQNKECLFHIPPEHLTAKTKFEVSVDTKAPPPPPPGLPCVRDPAKRIGAGYTIMWPGAQGKWQFSWTSGTGGNNANYAYNGMRLQSGQNTLDKNYFMVKVRTPMKSDYVVGFIVPKNSECLFFFPAGSLSWNSKFEVSVKTHK